MGRHSQYFPSLTCPQCRKDPKISSRLSAPLQAPVKPSREEPVKALRCAAINGQQASPQMTSHLKPLREFFGEFRAIQVGGRDIEAFKSQLKVAKKANATINRSLQLLSQAYSDALKSDAPKLNRAPMIKRYSEKGNVRKGKCTPAEAEAVFNSLPPYMADVARFAYETGHRFSEIRKLCWSHLEPDAIRVPGSITKNGRRMPDCFDRGSRRNPQS